MREEPLSNVGACTAYVPLGVHQEEFIVSSVKLILIGFDHGPATLSAVCA